MSDTRGQIAYAAWHGLSLPIAAEDWPEGDRMVKRWEQVGAAVSDAIRAAAIECAAAWVDARREAFCQDHGSIDPDTGALEFGRGEHARAKDEYVGELEDIACAIRALK